MDIPAPWERVPDTSSSKEANKVMVKHLPLGSRKNLCINPKVAKLGNAPAINERCLEIQQPETSKDQKCAFLPNKDNQDLVHDFRDHTLAKIRDIEDLGNLGRSIGICPYYAARATIKPSEVISASNIGNPQADSVPDRYASVPTVTPKVG